MKTKKKLADKPKRRRITFSFESPAEGVILMGDFNKWDAKKHPMKKDEDGVWRKIVVELESGRQNAFQDAGPPGVEGEQT